MNRMEIRNGRYDVVVCGGGTPGSAPPSLPLGSGAKVAVIEQRPILGGNSSSFAHVPPHGAAAFWHNRNAREGGIMEELLMEYAARSPLADCVRSLFDNFRFHDLSDVPAFCLIYLNRVLLQHGVYVLPIHNIQLTDVLVVGAMKEVNNIVESVCRV